MDHKSIKDIIEEEIKDEVAHELSTSDSLEEADIQDLSQLDGVETTQDETMEYDSLEGADIEDLSQLDGADDEDVMNSEEDESADNVVSKAIKDAKGSDTETPVVDVVDFTDADEDPSAPKEKKGLFGKKPKKDKKDEKIEELNDQLIRRMAEFENFRKRSEKEKSQMYDMGAKSIIEKLLPVVDNFERGLALIPEEEQDNPVKEGMDLIYKQLMTMLSDTGVQAIEAVGQTFNPDLHNAVMHVEDENAGEHVVVEEFQKGYTYRDTVVRYSMVKVAN